MNKFCPKCKLVLLTSQFNKRSIRKDGLQLWCKLCMKNNKSFRYWNCEGIKDKHYISARKVNLKKYGLTFDDYLSLLKKQKDVCWICKKSETQRSNKNGRVDSLRVDHCHETGKVRGLLCSKCNFGISQFNDSIKLLQKAIKYLKKHVKKI